MDHFSESVAVMKPILRAPIFQDQIIHANGSKTIRMTLLTFFTIPRSVASSCALNRRAKVKQSKYRKLVRRKWLVEMVFCWA